MNNAPSGATELKMTGMTSKQVAKETLILWEGPCAYVRVVRECHEIVVHSTNHVTHVCAGITDDAARAESICRRLNAYPRQTRAAYKLL